MYRATDEQGWAHTQAFADATRNSPEVRSKIEQAVQSKSLVYLQFADPGQRALAERLTIR
jgi:uncharacterized radical SAM superfamily Fe-S cluster-containing enzyme